MSYKIEFKSDALKFLKKQSKNQQIRIMKCIGKLPSSGDIKNLVGIKDENLYRLRIRNIQSNLFYKF